VLACPEDIWHFGDTHWPRRGSHQVQQDLEPYAGGAPHHFIEEFPRKHEIPAHGIAQIVPADELADMAAQLAQGYPFARERSHSTALDVPAAHD